MESEGNDGLVGTSHQKSGWKRIGETVRHPKSLILSHLDSFLEALDHSTNREVLEEGFDLVDELSSIDGPIIEFGGPTDSNSSAHSHPYLGEVKGSGQEFLVSNVRKSFKAMARNKKGEVRLVEFPYGKLDFLADATRMPLADNSTGAIFASHLPIFIRSMFMQETQRALRDNGLLVMQGATNKDLRLAETLGLKAIDIVTYRDRFGKRESSYDAVFRKVDPIIQEESEFPHEH